MVVCLATAARRPACARLVVRVHTHLAIAARIGSSILAPALAYLAVAACSICPIALEATWRWRWLSPRSLAPVKIDSSRTQSPALLGCANPMTAQITTLQPPVHPDPHVLQWQLALSALPLSIAASGWSAALEDLLAHRSPWSHLPAPAPRARWLGTMRLPAAPLAAIAAGHAGGARLSWPDATGFATHAIAAKMWTPPEVYGNRVRARRSGSFRLISAQRLIACALGRKGLHLLLRSLALRSVCAAALHIAMLTALSRLPYTALRNGRHLSIAQHSAARLRHTSPLSLRSLRALAVESLVNSNVHSPRRRGLQPRCSSLRLAILAHVRSQRSCLRAPSTAIVSSEPIAKRMQPQRRHHLQGTALAAAHAPLLAGLAIAFPVVALAAKRRTPSENNCTSSQLPRKEHDCTCYCYATALQVSVCLLPPLPPSPASP